LGALVVECNKIDCINDIYSDFFWDYEFNGLYIVRFTKKLVELFNDIDIDEFSMFVTHAYNDDDFNLIYNLIKIYRTLNVDKKKILIEKYKKYFNEIKETKGVNDRKNKNVYGNYYKNAKHNMSAIGWCKYFDFDADKFIIKNKI